MKENIRQCRQVPEQVCNTVSERVGSTDRVKECQTKTNSHPLWLTLYTLYGLNVIFIFYTFMGLPVFTVIPAKASSNLLTHLEIIETGFSFRTFTF